MSRRIGVSILARAEARALPVRTAPAVTVVPVSILARAEARALRYANSDLFPSILVSILARAEARALPIGTVSTNIANVFQSSPAPRRGRYLMLVSAATPTAWFQSSPAPRRGRYLSVIS